MNFFKKDVVLLLIISIMLGTGIAKLLSYGANIYFQQTLTSLVGDYGEYDLLLQMREDYKEEGKAQLDKVLQDNFPGASTKEGPAIIGKANVFISLPNDKKTQAIYENIDRMFSSVPGISGVSILTEPRLNIRGIPSGAAASLEDELKTLSGVDFVYRTGGSIGIVLKGTKQIQEVTSQAEKALTRNKIIDISFPVGIEPDNPVFLAEAISKELYLTFKPQIAQYVSVDTSNDDMVHLISTMQEIRRFLLNYATKVKLKAQPNVQLSPGDRVVFQGNESEQPTSGAEIKQGNIVVLVTETESKSSFKGIIMQGDVNYFKNKQGLIANDKEVGEGQVIASFENPRIVLVKALQESADLLDKLPDIVKEGDEISSRVDKALSGYTEDARRMQSNVDRMDDAVSLMQRATDRLEAANIRGLRKQLDQSAQSMSGLLSALRLVKVFNPDVAGAMSNLESTQVKLQGFSELLEGMDEITAQASQAKAVLGGVVKEGKSVADALEKFEGSKAQSDLLALNKQLKTLHNTDFQQMAKEVRQLAINAPRLSDEDIYRSVKLMDKVIEGQIIPGKRLQIMVDRNLPLAQAKPIIYKVLGHENVGIYETDLGVIEPNLYLQFYQVLKEVQAVLAGLASLVLTALFLAIDHTAIMSVLQGNRLRQQLSYKGKITLKQRFYDFIGRLFYIENLYGMGIGALLLSTMFFLSGGGIPYVPWFIIPPIGAFIGLGIASLTEKITPVAWDEILAGQSLGMSFEEIMREIVIPGARPGLLQWLNRRKLYFRN